MSENNIAIAEAYYIAASKKDLASMESYLHPKMEFVGPFGEVFGKEAFLEALKKFLGSFTQLTIRSKCCAGNLVTMVYNVDFPQPIGICRTAALLTIKNNLIARIELFFDTRPFPR